MAIEFAFISIDKVKVTRIVISDYLEVRTPLFTFILDRDMS